MHTGLEKNSLLNENVKTGDQFNENSTDMSLSRHTTKSIPKIIEENNLSTGWFYGIFDHTGGRLSTVMSDDYLEIPEGAIPSDKKWLVMGNIYTSLSEFDHLKHTHTDIFIAPIIEYKLDVEKEFNTPVKIYIHHTLREEHFDKVRVTLRNASNEEEICERIVQKGRKSWFKIENDYIIVFTYHFSLILCTMCNYEARDGYFEGSLFSCLTNKGDTTEVSLRFFFKLIPSITAQKVFSEVRYSVEDLYFKRYSVGRPILKDNQWWTYLKSYPLVDLF